MDKDIDLPQSNDALGISDATPPFGPSLPRRSFLKLSFLTSCSLAVAGAGLLSRPLVGWAAAPVHGLSVFGGLKYAPGFRHFDYVNPEAPKGGRFVFSGTSWDYNQNVRTFNTLNGFVLKGDAPARIELLFDTLMVRAYDEPDAVYCLLAKHVMLSEDGNRFTIALQPEARFHDGSPLRAEDVVFSYEILKEKGHPNIRDYLRDLTSIAQQGEDIVFTFSGKQGRQAVLDALSEVPIFSRAYYKDRVFDASTLDAPMGSGPYRVGKLKTGTFIEYHRNEDYWAAKLPVAVGHHNFDVVRMEFARDHTAQFEAFKKGEITFMEEFSSKAWATQYDFPAIRDGRATKLELPDGRPAAAQGFFFNTRRSKLSDPRTREALAMVFDFEWTNKKLFYGLYQRTHSFFERTNIKAEGAPTGDVLALLNAHKDQLDEAVFGPAILPPITDGSGRDRKVLAEASRLLSEAGWKHGPDGLVNDAGDVLELEFLVVSSLMERIINPWAETLGLLGVKMTIRIVDASQYQFRLDQFDYDLVSARFALTANISASSRSLWGSAAADRPGSYNLSGVKHPVIDAMLEKALNAESREEMEVAGEVIDRIWRQGHYWVPSWYRPIFTLAIWKKFGWPNNAGLYEFLPEQWWWAEGQN